MKCPMCGTEYSPDEAASACAKCPLARGRCALVRCPKCGYETVAETRLGRLARKLKQFALRRSAGA
jgi:hypothetical protein